MIKTSYLKTIREKDILLNKLFWEHDYEIEKLLRLHHRIYKKNPDELKSTGNIKLKK